ncbi:MAG: hypothetical protein A2Z49_01500 [Chloroflexi bacterium RBG_19FT_COMBO_56_12]|nr:MAG: hypothetical protein A2Z49_01500 [Chloroflexi bacterium RBG_19FT_COMBO_56_12]
MVCLAIAKFYKLYYNYLKGRCPRWTSDDKKGETKMEFEGYCVKCRKKQKVKNGTEKTASNGRKMAQGTCPVCGTKVTRFLSNKK